MTALAIGYLCLLILFCVAGVLLTALQLPGTWLIVIASASYGWLDGWGRLGMKVVALLAVLALVGEIVEFTMGGIVARRSGGSRRAAWGAIIGGFAGMVLLSVPVPLIGTIIGGVIGCFAGAVVAELTLHDDIGRGARVGAWSAVGRVVGLVSKLAIAFAMAAVAVSAAVVN
jgi:uncharacterized protein YqgC (DUF456 family)